jgi:hypothetical protein
MFHILGAFVIWSLLPLILALVVLMIALVLSPLSILGALGSKRMHPHYTWLSLEEGNQREIDDRKHTEWVTSQVTLYKEDAKKWDLQKEREQNLDHNKLVLDKFWNHNH